MDRYSMDCRDMGTFIFFHIFEFEDGWQRSLPSEEFNALKESMAKLGFSVIYYKNPTRNEIFEALRKWTSNRVNTGVNSFGCAISCHGWYHGWLTTYKKDEWINVKEIQHYLHEDVCPALNGKPKLLFIDGLF